ncbi:hypothetical protein FPCIR_3674 [Fusarium pseudocircinatum]|uniref:DDE-1 domain-containing protein n=1 Tax=Fusarium pseudocircinatum TaxID=56676 RepID=A0A8H5PIT2_9HYPO|nr:hypothetical protein FPCIR_3674 [Fusarium pseudocircinatum]
MGRRQKAKRFDSFTPKVAHWYFNIREGQYGWIKPENTVNVDEGGIMTGFAVIADGRALIPGIIFKGKELQKQWFLDEFKQITDWYYRTSPNGWTDNHIGIEWLERVYLPQTRPRDESDARLIILDGHGSHATPLDNGVFNASKAAYRKELEKFASLTASSPMDKVNFIRAYAKARQIELTRKNILSGWRVTGNWPISRAKALRHPEIQQDRPDGSPRVTPEPRPYLGSGDTPQTSRQIRDLGLNKTPKTRRRYNVIAKGFEAQQQTVAAHTQRIASLEDELARLKRGKKRKAVPNPNKRFMTLGEALASGETMAAKTIENLPVEVEYVCSSEEESVSEAGSVIQIQVGGTIVSTGSGATQPVFNELVGFDAIAMFLYVSADVLTAMLPHTYYLAVEPDEHVFIDKSAYSKGMVATYVGKDIEAVDHTRGVWKGDPVSLKKYQDIFNTYI